MAKFIPGSELLGRGFDTFGSLSTDSTFGFSKLFDLDKLDNESGQTFRWDDQDWDVPLNCEPSLQTNVDIGLKAFESRTELSKYLSVKSKIKGKYKAFSGELSSSFKLTSTSQSERFLARAEYNLESLQLVIEQHNFDWLTEEAKDAISSLPTEFDPQNPNEFFRFFNKFGSHFVDAVTLGGHLVYTASLERSEVENLTEFENKAKATFNAVMGNVSGSVETEWNLTTKEFVQNSEVHIRASGGDVPPELLAPPTFGEPSRAALLGAWGETVNNSPAAVAFHLESVASVVDDDRHDAVLAAIAAYTERRMTFELDVQGFMGSAIFEDGERLFRYYNNVGSEISGRSANISLIVVDRKTCKTVANRTFEWETTTSKLMEDVSQAFTDYTDYPDVIIAVAFWGMSTSVSGFPSPTLRSLLRDIGFGSGFRFWEANNNVSIGAIDLNYLVCGIRGGGEGSAFEALKHIPSTGDRDRSELSSTSTIFLAPTMEANGEFLYTPR